MFTLLRIRFYPFSYRSVLPVHTATDTFENGMKMMTYSHRSALDKKENATNSHVKDSCSNLRGLSILLCCCCCYRFQKYLFSVFTLRFAFSKVSVFKVGFQKYHFSQCERKVKTDTFRSFFIGIRSNVNGA